MAKLPLHRCDIAGFLDEVPAHGMAIVMGRMAPEASQVAHFTEDRIDHPEVETTFAVTVLNRTRGLTEIGLKAKDALHNGMCN